MFSRSSKAARRRQRGFTLMEILVAIAILGLLTGLAISKLGNTYETARRDAAKLFVTTSVKVPLFSYKMRMGDFPTTQEGMQALITPPATRAASWSGPYLEGSSVPLDPWGEPYHYACPGTHNKDGYDIWSGGPDKQTGTDDDIGNWDAAPKQQ